MLEFLYLNLLALYNQLASQIVFIICYSLIQHQTFQTIQIQLTLRINGCAQIHSSVPSARRDGAGEGVREGLRREGREPVRRRQQTRLSRRARRQGAPHFSLLTSHFTLHSPHFTLHTSHSTLLC